jgi:hypothetical protein
LTSRRLTVPATLLATADEVIEWLQRWSVASSSRCSAGRSRRGLTGAWKHQDALDARAVQRIERLRDVGYTTRLEYLHADAKSLCRSLDPLALQRTRGRVPTRAILTILHRFVVGSGMM